MNPFSLRTVGRTSLQVTQYGFGGGTLGDPVEIISEEQADATLAAAYDAGVKLFDTAPWYGNNKSEHRVGHYLRTRPRGSYKLTTKVGRVYSRPENAHEFHHPRWAGGLPFALRFDYSRDGVLRAYEQSLMRLGINTVDALTIHDLDLRHRENEDNIRQGFRELDAGGGFAALQELKAGGEIQAIGAGINLMGMIPRFVEHFDLDYFLLASPYTLLDQPALDEELPLCAERGIGIVIGGVFASGILATGAGENALYAYKPAPEEILQKVRRMEAVCKDHNVPLSAAALQFPLGHPAVATVLAGSNSPDQVESNLRAFGTNIPADLWAELKQTGLLRADAPTDFS